MIDVLTKAMPFKVELIGASPDFGSLAAAFALCLVVSVVLDIALGQKKLLSLGVIPVNFAVWTLLLPFVSGLLGKSYSADLLKVLAIFGESIGQLGLLVVAYWVVEALLCAATTIVFKPFGEAFDAKFDAWVTAPVLEELAFRLVLLSALLNSGVDVGAAIVIQALAYSLSQIKNGIMSGFDKWVGIDNVIHTYLVGLCLGMIALQSGIVCALAFHIAFDILFDVAQTFTPGGE